MRADTEPLTVSRGPISSIEIPEGWLEEKRKAASPPSMQTLLKFHRPENKDIQLCIYYRGRPVSENSATVIRAVLDKPDHELNEEELSMLQEILGNLAYEDHFQPITAVSRELGGKKVLDIRGLWNNLKLSGYHLFIDGDGSGNFIWEIYFAAPYESFEMYLATFEKALETLVWTESTDI